MHLPQIGGKLSKLEGPACDIVVWLDDVPPRRKAGGIDLDRKGFLLCPLEALLILLEHESTELSTHLVGLVRLLHGTDRAKNVLAIHEHPLSPLRGDPLPVRPLLPGVPQSRDGPLVFER